MKRNRLTALLLAMSILFTGFSVPAYAAEPAADSSAVTQETELTLGDETIYREGSGDLEELYGAEVLVKEEVSDVAEKKSYAPVVGSQSEFSRLTQQQRDFLTKTGSRNGYDALMERYPQQKEILKEMYQTMLAKCQEYTIDRSNSSPAFVDVKYRDENGKEWIEKKTYQVAFEIDYDEDKGLEQDMMYELYFMFRHDNPQYFWLSNSVLVPRKTRTWSDGRAENFYSGIKVCVFDAFKDGQKRWNNFQTIVDTMYGTYFSQVEPGDSRHDKILKIHDTLINTIYYPDLNDPTEYKEYSHSIAQVLLEGRSVCEGYAKLMQLSMNYYKIPNYYVTGVAFNGTTYEENGAEYYTAEAHAWNYVQMWDGNWYGLDATWDDVLYTDGTAAESFQHVYFLVGSETEVSDKGGIEKFKLDHQPDKGGSGGSYLYPLPALSKEKYVHNPDVPDPNVPELEPEPEYEPGDVTMDGVVNLLDLRAILRHICQKTMLEGDALVRADVNSDNLVNLLDLRYVLRKICGKI